ncbi:hypothetical protein JOD45_001634 [Scopulibacillus daqui]|uniref:Uncharacterized protein n=1 Tax=Scopulibacillus daqui TaxID=1469162 RepID=A0ABS2PZF2_9BACL|nr:hypothetical protein [Scopulibacillus daqui]MBM7645423.1 hypothetical protein [Scopulibacillus daqui]
MSLDDTPFIEDFQTDDWNTFFDKKDRYDVYVNGEFVGMKKLFSGNETIDDINDFLAEHGFSSYKAVCDGDYYHIYTSRHPEKLKEILSFHLQSR